MQTTKSFKFTPTAKNTQVYTFLINAVAITYTSDGSATVAEIVAGLVAAVTAAAISGVSATDHSTYFTVQGTAGTFFSIELTAGAPYMQLECLSADPGYATELDAIKAENNSWYGLDVVDHSLAILEAVAAWVETNKKVMIAATQDTTVGTNATTDVMSAIKTSAYRRTACAFHHAPHQGLGAAAFGKMLPKQPGSYTFFLKTFAGIASSMLSDTQISYIKGKNGNTYRAIKDVNYFIEGKVGSGEYLDTIIGIDWWTDDAETELLAAMAAVDKIGRDDDGYASLEAVFRALVDAGVKAKLFRLDFVAYPDFGYLLNFPAVDDASSADRSTRQLTGVTGEVKLDGALHGITFKFNVI